MLLTFEIMGNHKQKFIFYGMNGKKKLKLATADKNQETRKTLEIGPYEKIRIIVIPSLLANPFIFLLMLLLYGIVALCDIIGGVDFTLKFYKEIIIPVKNKDIYMEYYPATDSVHAEDLTYTVKSKGTWVNVVALLISISIIAAIVFICIYAG